MGSVEQYAPVKIHKFHTKQILIKHLPRQCSQEKVTELVSQYGGIQKFDFVSSDKDCSASIIFESTEQAQRAHDGLNGESFDGAVLKVDYVTDRTHHGRSRSESRMSGGKRSATNLPLRILVPSQYIGAIIGKKGESIKSITTKCKARVDVHGKENNGLLEKVISIYGQPDNCSNACREILTVIHNELKSEAKQELLLKMLTNNYYCGRIIGREGRTIKKIREETGTKIIVNSTSDLALFPDRVISIKGNIDNMVQAEQAIASKLAQCIEQDYKYPTYVAGSQYMNGYQYVPSANMITDQKFYTQQNTAGGAHMTRSCPGNIGGGPTSYIQPTSVAHGPVQEVSHIQVPNSAVGAIIGSKGANIKQMMKISGAFITVESRGKEAELTPASERIVTIRGAPDAAWRANYYIFEKLKAEGFSGNDDVRLMTMITIPRVAVGRVIGKSGRNVREIQRLTGSIIKLPLDSKNPVAGQTGGAGQGLAGQTGVAGSQTVSGEPAVAVQQQPVAGQQQPQTAVEGDQQQLSAEVTVEVHGTFNSTQTAQRRIRALVELAMNGVSSTYATYLFPRYSRSTPRVSTA